MSTLIAVRGTAMSNINSQVFARAVMRAQALHDGSWNNELWVHKIMHHEAAEIACKEFGLGSEWVRPIYLLNVCAWNDIQMWAKEQKP